MESKSGMSKGASPANRQQRAFVWWQQGFSLGFPVAAMAEGSPKLAH